MQSEIYLNNSREISQIEQIMRFSGRWQEHGDCLLVNLESGVDQDLQKKNNTINQKQECYQKIWPVAPNILYKGRTIYLK